MAVVPYSTTTPYLSNVPPKFIRMIIHFQQKKFMIVLPIDATVADCKLEIIRVYRGLGGSQEVQSIEELKDSEECTLFDEYKIGMLLYDKSELFATAAGRASRDVSLSACPHSSTKSDSGNVSSPTLSPIHDISKSFLAHVPNSAGTIRGSEVAMSASISRPCRKRPRKSKIPKMNIPGDCSEVSISSQSSQPTSTSARGCKSVGVKGVTESSKAGCDLSGFSSSSGGLAAQTANKVNLLTAKVGGRKKYSKFKPCLDSSNKEGYFETASSENGKVTEVNERTEFKLISKNTNTDRVKMKSEQEVTEGQSSDDSTDSEPSESSRKNNELPRANESSDESDTESIEVPLPEGGDRKYGVGDLSGSDSDITTVATHPKTVSMQAPSGAASKCSSNSSSEAEIDDSSSDEENVPSTEYSSSLPSLSLLVESSKGKTQHASKSVPHTVKKSLHQKRPAHSSSQPSKQKRKKLPIVK